MLFISRNKLVFFEIAFLSSEINCVFPQIYNNLMRALGRKNTFVFGNAQPKSNVRAHL